MGIWAIKGFCMFPTFSFHYSIVDWMSSWKLSKICECRVLSTCQICISSEQWKAKKRTPRSALELFFSSSPVELPRLQVQVVLACGMFPFSLVKKGVHFLIIWRRQRFFYSQSLFMNHKFYDAHVDSSTKGDADAWLDAPFSIFGFIILVGLIMQRYLLALPFSAKIMTKQGNFVWAGVIDEQVEFLTLFEMVSLIRWIKMISNILIFAALPCLQICMKQIQQEALSM